MPKIIGKKIGIITGEGSGTTTKKGKTLRARPRTPAGGGGPVAPSGYRGAPTLLKPPPLRGAKGDGPTPASPPTDGTTPF